MFSFSQLTGFFKTIGVALYPLRTLLEIRRLVVSLSEGKTTLSRLLFCNMYFSRGVAAKFLDVVVVLEWLSS